MFGGLLCRINKWSRQVIIHGCRQAAYLGARNFRNSCVCFASLLFAKQSEGSARRKVESSQIGRSTVKCRYVLVVQCNYSVVVLKSVSKVALRKCAKGTLGQQSAMGVERWCVACRRPVAYASSSIGATGHVALRWQARRSVICGSSSSGWLDGPRASCTTPATVGREIGLSGSPAS